MAKKSLNLSVGEETILAAKKKGLNFSAIAEQAVVAELEKDTYAHTCEFCNKIQIKATAEKPIGLTWLSPDEKWICTGCLQEKVESVIKGKKYDVST